MARFTSQDYLLRTTDHVALRALPRGAAPYNWALAPVFVSAGDGDSVAAARSRVPAAGRSGFLGFWAMSLSGTSPTRKRSTGVEHEVTRKAADRSIVAVRPKLMLGA
jgi:hypothetical protein